MGWLNRNWKAFLAIAVFAGIAGTIIGVATGNFSPHIYGAIFLFSALIWVGRKNLWPF